jgi:3-phenylpropionate/trans-cinnamate dioxygenase ferredoxin reductase subunit
LSRNLKNIFYVRSILDVNYMASHLMQGKKVLIIGGGYIGLEAAAVCRKLGVNVKIIEMDKRILNRVSSSQTANYFKKLHKNHGVEVREGVTLDTLLGETQVEKAILSDGTKMNIDFVIVGIGVLPNDNLASEAGLDIENGIKTNSLGQTSNESIWAAGDCASFPWKGKRIRLESVQNAIDQSEIVAENILGGKKSYIPSPWFWSDQYDVKLQIAGLNTGYDQIAVRKGDRANSVSHWYYNSGTLISVDAMNDPRSYMIGKRIIESGNTVSPIDIENPDYDLKKLIKK